MRSPCFITAIFLAASLAAASAQSATHDQPASAPPAASQAMPATPMEAYAVYSASLPFGYHTQGMKVAIRSRTIAVPSLEYASRSVQKEFASMQKDPDLAQAIRQMMTARPSQDLARDFRMSERYELLDSDALDGELRLNDTPLGRKAGWRAFNQNHTQDDGLTELSAIGYNPAHTVAVFYAIHRSGTGCNDEGFEVLRKSKGRWQRNADKGFSFAACN